MVLNTILFDLKNSAGIEATRFRVAGYINLKQSSRFKTNGYFTKNYELLVCDLEQHIYEQGNWEIFFAFARESKSFAIVCAVAFLFVLLLSVFERPIVSCTFD